MKRPKRINRQGLHSILKNALLKRRQKKVKQGTLILGLYSIELSEIDAEGNPKKWKTVVEVMQKTNLNDKDILQPKNF